MVHELPPGGEDHDIHIKAGVKCWDCHDPLRTIRGFSAMDIYDKCRECHELTEAVFHEIYERGVIDCRKCHNGWSKGKTTVKINLSIDKLCDECHGAGYLGQVLPSNCTLRVHISLLGCPEYCHRGIKHEDWLSFAGNTTFCSKCHALTKTPFHDKMSVGSNCMKCHRFRLPLIVSPELNCLSCHPERIRSEVIKKGYHSIHTKLTNCTTCHHGLSHEEWFKSASKVEACIGCHDTSQLPLHDNLRAGTLCVSCHKQWLESIIPLYRIPCEGCHGIGFANPIIFSSMHIAHNTLDCTQCHSEKSHAQWFISTDSPEICLKCHTIEGTTPGYISTPPLNHARFVNTAKGNCFNCHKDWDNITMLRVKLSSEINILIVFIMMIVLPIKNLYKKFIF